MTFDADLSPKAPIVAEITAEDTHELRRAVLRSGTLTTDVRFDDDHAPTTFHLGVRIDGLLVAVSTWIERRHPDHPHLEGSQIRGMATDPERRGTGLGSLLLTAGIDRLTAEGGDLVWARARDSALGFYLAHGFDTFGRGYTDLTTGLPHHDVVRRI